MDDPDTSFDAMTDREFDAMTDQDFIAMDRDFEAMTDKDFEQLERGLLDPTGQILDSDSGMMDSDCGTVDQDDMDQLEWDPQVDEGSPMLVSAGSRMFFCSSLTFTSA